MTSVSVSVSLTELGDLPTETHTSLSSLSSRPLVNDGRGGPIACARVGKHLHILSVHRNSSEPLVIDGQDNIKVDHLDILLVTQPLARNQTIAFGHSGVFGLYSSQLTFSNEYNLSKTFELTFSMHQGTSLEGHLLLSWTPSTLDCHALDQPTAPRRWRLEAVDNETFHAATYLPLSTKFALVTSRRVAIFDSGAAAPLPLTSRPHGVRDADASGPRTWGCWWRRPAQTSTDVTGGERGGAENRALPALSLLCLLRGALFLIQWPQEGAWDMAELHRVLSPGGPMKGAAAVDGGAFVVLQESELLTRHAGGEDDDAMGDDDRAASAGDGDDGPTDLRRCVGANATGILANLTSIGGATGGVTSALFNLGLGGGGGDAAVSRGGAPSLLVRPTGALSGPTAATAQSVGGRPRGPRTVPAMLSLFVPLATSIHGSSAESEHRRPAPAHVGNAARNASLELGLPFPDLLTCHGDLVGVSSSGIDPVLLLYRCTLAGGIEPLCQLSLAFGAARMSPDKARRVRGMALLPPSARAGPMRLGCLVSERKKARSPFLAGSLAGAPATAYWAMHEIPETAVTAASADRNDCAAVGASSVDEGVGKEASRAELTPQQMLGEVQRMVAGLQAHVDARFDRLEAMVRDQTGRMGLIEGMLSLARVTGPSA